MQTIQTNAADPKHANICLCTGRPRPNKALCVLPVFEDSWFKLFCKQHQNRYLVPLISTSSHIRQQVASMAHL